MNTLHALVLEYPGEFGETPELMVDETRDALTRRLIRTLAELNRTLTAGLAQTGESAAWLASHPIPDWESDADLPLWLQGLHDVCSGFWWTFYEINGLEAGLA